MQTRKNINKQFLCLFVPVAVVLGLIVGYFYFSEVEKERAGLEANEILHVNLVRQVIEKDLEAAVADLGVLSQHREFDKIDTPRNPEALEHLAQEFLIFVQNKQHYDQIRFLDEDGKEVIRINLGSGHPYIVPEAQLQDKSRRYYFADAMLLKEGEILVSPLDLNIEHGSVVRPVKPTIRLATTVLYGQGKKRGVIVLNYLGSSLMRVLKEVETGIEDHAMILNADGYWLGDPRAEHGLTFKNQFPEAWKRIAKADGGSFYKGKGLFAFATVYPQREVWKLTTGATVADEPIRSEVEGKDKEYHWKVVAHVSSQHIDAATAAVSMKLLLTSASLFGFLAASVWWLAQAQVRRLEAEEALTKRASQQAAVAVLGQRALSGKGLAALMDTIVEYVSKVLGVEYCKILELLPDGKALVLRAGVGWKEGLVGQAIVGTGMDSQAGYTLACQDPVIVEDLRQETRFTGPQLLHDHGVVSGMSV
ncbi:MAG: GAF domain-containing protein, partial [Gammaproteobacteria bacterium]|nr:GAF domain-containing protein [Gammaproteobacteria bacterium]